MRVLRWLVLLLVAFPVFWTGEKLLQNYLVQQIRDELIGQIADRSIFVQRFALLEPLSFSNYSLWGMHDPETNIGTSLNRNALQSAIEGRFFFGTLPKRSHIAYIKTVRTKAGRPATTWYRGVLKICGDAPCQWKDQEFTEVLQPPDELLTSRWINREETRWFLWLRFDIHIGLKVNGFGEIRSISFSINDWATNPIDRFLRGAWPNKPFLGDEATVSQVLVSFPQGICEDDLSDPSSLGNACF